jgi:glycosyltransferase involved in cell wall biosynthesis
MNLNQERLTLLITNKLEEFPVGGRQMLCKLNHRLLHDLSGSNLWVTELKCLPVNSFLDAVKAFKGHIDGVNADVIRKIILDIESNNIKYLFVDGSNFGEVVKAVKIKYPNLHVYTFFHNVEARFFWGSFIQNKTIKSLSVCVANYLAEKKSVRFSDSLICLSQRDSELMHKIYGRKATQFSPIALEDKLPLTTSKEIPVDQEKFALFVGGDFYANRFGISWFVKNVAPRINIKICIVGKGFDRYKHELESSGNVEVVGMVENLSEWYLNAYFVIAPIFDGSGMKTKVAEALMYGKKIIGTPEAFSGYEDIAHKAGRVCLDAEDFVGAIGEAEKIVTTEFDGELRSIYESKYSFEAARTRLCKILDIDS